MYLSRLLPPLAGVLLAACSSGEPLAKASMEHGISPGDAVASVKVPCMSGPDREVAEKNKLQVVTFATPYDCSACTPHMAGVPRVLRHINEDQKGFVVVWSPNKKMLQRSLGQAKSDLPICIDEAGVFWDRHDIQHTPFTVVIDDGRVVYTTDAVFTQRDTEEKFARDLKVLIARSASARAPSRSTASR
ncbi:TlpA family protein disulfide reductase [Longimicrobium terrae]|uniref:Thioredoxin domain-containing protein n=1 Tax=Longimicrobium terrae TaxID=1639882 RepID=A0A841GSZ8_9BACT|nr:hypothetical protein [Longimicrobium terrae]MBB4635175.1 hypothetical protein [Longimicrobium terrae]MBB6069569.1 hypothetical protein [Longimicrobium terrae]NNC31628.1 hypothetical protein [Longimicrobium terrae]